VTARGRAYACYTADTLRAAEEIRKGASAAPAPGLPHHATDATARSFARLRDSGLLWLINRVALHPRGLALALHIDSDGHAYGWSLVSDSHGEPWQFDPATDSDGYERAEATIAAALNDTPDPVVGIRCCVCGGGPVSYENFQGDQFCAGCANCSCGLDDCVRSRPDGRPDADVDGAGRTREAVLDTAMTSTDTIRTRQDADASGRPDKEG